MVVAVLGRRHAPRGRRGGRCSAGLSGRHRCPIWVHVPHAPTALPARRQWGRQWPLHATPTPCVWPGGRPVRRAACGSLAREPLINSEIPRAMNGALAHRSRKRLIWRERAQVWPGSAASERLQDGVVHTLPRCPALDQTWTMMSRGSAHRDVFPQGICNPLPATRPRSPYQPNQWCRMPRAAHTPWARAAGTSPIFSNRAVFLHEIS